MEVGTFVTKIFEGAFSGNLYRLFKISGRSFILENFYIQVASSHLHILYSRRSILRFSHIYWTQISKSLREE